MYLPSTAVVGQFIDEGVMLGRDYASTCQVGRSRVVWGRGSGRPYLVRWGLLEAIAERFYYEWACSRGLGARPVQFVVRPGGRVRHLSMTWWTEGTVESETIRPAKERCVAANPLDVPHLTALDLLLDNSPRFSGWMLEDGRVYRLFNQRALGFGSGPIPLLTRFRLCKQGGVRPHLDLDTSAAGFSGPERDAFYAEASRLAAISDDGVRDLCRIPLPVGIEAYRFCLKAMGRGPGSREVMKLLLKSGPRFLEEYAYEYIRSRRLVLATQLKLGRRA